MASAPQQQLPLFYNDLMPLNSRDHSKFRIRRADHAKWLANQHAIPLTTDEFAVAQRFYPIVFSSDENPVPLALMGLNHGVNTFFDDEGKPVVADAYLPAYVRRYPFMLARLEQNSDSMTLCFDPTSEIVGEFEEGEALFDGEASTPTGNEILEFCKRFEEGGRMTGLFIEELKKHDLLMDGEVSITRESSDQPFIYRGFKMINQEKLRELRGDILRTWNQNGILGVIYAHLISLDLMRQIFARQVAQGKGPEGTKPD